MDAYFPRHSSSGSGGSGGGGGGSGSGQKGSALGPEGLRGDVIITGDSADGGVRIVDVVINAPHTTIPAARTLAGAGATATRSEKAKRDHYNNAYAIADPEVIVPFALETAGHMGPSADKLIRFLAARTRGVTTAAEYASRVRFMRQRISVLLVRANARMVADWRRRAFGGVGLGNFAPEGGGRTRDTDGGPGGGSPGGGGPGGGGTGRGERSGRDPVNGPLVTVTQYHPKAVTAVGAVGVGVE